MAINQRRRSGYTLLEILLVLAVLVAVASLAIPVLRGPLDTQTLKKSADLVRGQFAQARNRAMSSGRTLVFRYEIGGSQYQLEVWHTDDDWLNVDERTAQTSGPGGEPAAADTLPERVRFAGGTTMASARALPIEQALGPVSASQGWSAPILFYPDGTTSTAEVNLANDQGDFISVRLRGLTGLARVGELKREFP